MNIQIAFFKRIGLTTEQINATFKELNEDIRRARSDMDFWKSEMKKRQPKKKCTKCRELISLWPFEEEGYYIKGNRVTHIHCKN